MDPTIVIAANNDVTSESEFSMEAFPNYTPAEAFVQSLAGLVNQSDVETMLRAQKQMLQRFEKTNEMLVNCNALSQSRLKQANEDFRKHCKVLGDMKKDLDYIFRKIRNIKQRLGQQYPIAFAEAQPQRSSLAEEAEDETEVRNAAANAVQQKEDQKLKMKSTGINVDTASATTATETVTTTATTNTTVEYVQMEEMIDNGKPIDNELIKRVCSLETPNPNDSSDCTSEDTA